MFYPCNCMVSYDTYNSLSFYNNNYRGIFATKTIKAIINK